MRLVADAIPNPDTIVDGVLEAEPTIAGVGTFHPEGEEATIRRPPHARHLEIAQSER
jgi:phage tail protein X